MLTYLGVLTNAAGYHVREYVPELMPTLVAGLVDLSLAKREAALNALGARPKPASRAEPGPGLVKPGRA
ncbi:hypothetical protein B0H19DRAFT_1272738 [Mycena capillaripes]|nr:hypothetical protein B0H19DRAFT_1272738 [Mycena capillaripes]